MPIYEHVSGERQLTAEGSLMDTELGVKALDPASGWRRVDPPQPADATEPPPPTKDTKTAAARRTTTRS